MLSGYYFLPSPLRFLQKTANSLLKSCLPLLPTENLGFCCCSVAESCPTLRTHGLQHTGFSVLHHLWSLLKLMSIESLMPSNHLILCHLLLLPPVSPSIRSFSVQLFASGGQNIGASTSASVHPMYVQDLFLLGLTGLILLSKELSRVFSSTEGLAMCSRENTQFPRLPCS